MQESHLSVEANVSMGGQLLDNPRYWRPICMDDITGQKALSLSKVHKSPSGCQVSQSIGDTAKLDVPVNACKGAKSKARQISRTALPMH